jgi:hypothetical protein
MKKTPFGIPYLNILKRSWEITWNNRYLWWFGLFVALLNFSGINFYFDSFEKNNGADFQKGKLAEFISQNTHLIAIGAIAILIIFIGFVILNILGRGALINSIGEKIENKFSGFKSGLAEGKKSFWKIFLISASLGLFLISASVIIVSPIVFLFYNGNYIAGLFMSLLAILILIPLIILSSYLKIFGYLYITLGKIGFWPSLENAYTLFRKNFWESIVMGLLFIPLSILLTMIMLMLIIPLIIVFIAFGFLIFFLAGKIAVIVWAILGIFAILAIILFVRSVYEVFSQSVWILFFYEIGKIKESESAVETEPETAPVAEKPLPIIDSGRE